MLSLVFPSIALKIPALHLYCLNKKGILERRWSNSLKSHVLKLLNQGLSTWSLLKPWSWIIFCCGRSVLLIEGCLADSLASTNYLPVMPTPKNVFSYCPMSAKSFLIEEHCFKVWNFKPFTLSEELCLDIQVVEWCLGHKRILPIQLDQTCAHFYLVSAALPEFPLKRPLVMV